MKAWYFSTAGKRLRYDDNREIAIGVTHTVEVVPVPCERGLHGSVRILDALSFAPGPIIWEVELGGTIVEAPEHDKYAATERTYLRGGIDVSDTLREFARWAALSVAHLWAIPDIVREYLESGDESIRAAARAAAWDAAWGTAWVAAWVAAWGAAGDAVWVAAWVAARGAAGAEKNTKLAEMIEAAIAAAQHATPSAEGEEG